MKHMTVAEVVKNFDDIVNNVVHEDERIIITVEGKDAVAIVPMADLEYIEALEDELDILSAKAAMREMRIHGTIPFAEVKKNLGIE